jgi:putative two-component system hydrogenase maturation factor HypX/HoxX
MADKVYEDRNYFDKLDEFAQALAEDEEKYSDFLYEKEEYLSKESHIMEQKKEQELKVMYSEFWDENSPFHKLRHEFVYKTCIAVTPRKVRFL